MEKILKCSECGIWYSSDIAQVGDVAWCDICRRYGPPPRNSVFNNMTTHESYAQARAMFGPVFDRLDADKVRRDYDRIWGKNATWRNNE